MANINAGKALEYLDMALDAGQLAQIVPSLYRRFFSGGNDAEKKKRIDELLKQGKTDQATDELLSELGMGFSRKDEMRLLTDVCYLVSGKKLTAAQGAGFMVYLKGLGQKKKERFRTTYTSEVDRFKRWTVLKTMALLPNDDLRNAFLDGPGVVDPSAVEEMRDSFTQFFENRLAELGAKAKARLENKRKVERLAKKALATPPPAPVPSRIKSAWVNFKSRFSFKIT